MESTGKKISVLIFALALVSSARFAVAIDNPAQPPALPVAATSSDAAGTPVACTLEYAPVCGEQVVYCIKAPCPPIKTTYGNRCQLNAAKAKFLYNGECKKDEVKKPVTEEILKARIAQLEARVKRLEKENRRLFNLIKLRESKIKALQEACKK
jgi:hypothetical protein